MPDLLTSELKTSLAWLFQDTLDLSFVADASQLDYHATLPDGTGADQADKIWHDERFLAAGANEDLLLSSLLRSLYGNTLSIALTKVKAILLVNMATAAGENLTIGGAPTQEWQGPFAAAGGKLVVPADSCLLLVNKKSGWAVGAGSADKLRIANSGPGGIAYRIAILGASA